VGSGDETTSRAEDELISETESDEEAKDKIIKEGAKEKTRKKEIVMEDDDDDDDDDDDEEGDKESDIISNKDDTLEKESVLSEYQEFIPEQPFLFRFFDWLRKHSIVSAITTLVLIILIALTVFGFVIVAGFCFGGNMLVMPNSLRLCLFVICFVYLLFIDTVQEFILPVKHRV
jgi:hypothetical protein